MDDYSFYATAAKLRATRIAGGIPTLRDQVQHLRDSAGVYLVGSSSLGCYKIGFNMSLRSGIGSCADYDVKIDTVMYCEIDGGRQAAQQLRDLFQDKKIDGIRGEWFKLSEADLKTAMAKFAFENVELVSAAPPSDLVFKCENFRPFEGGPAICWDGASGVVLIKKTGEIIYGRLKGEKKDLLARYSDGDKLLLAWHGQWRTDIFVITPANFAEMPDSNIPS